MNNYLKDLFFRMSRTEWIAFMLGTGIMFLAIVKGYESAALVSYFGLCSAYIAGRSFVKGRK